MNVCVT